MFKQANGGGLACCKWNTAGNGDYPPGMIVCQEHAEQLDGLLAYLQRYKGQYLVLNSGNRVDIPEGA